MKIKINKRDIKLIGYALIAGLFLGWLFFHSGLEIKLPKESITEHEHSHEGESAETIWTCSMHPRIKMDKPGQCPICAMDLVPLTNIQAEEASSPDEVQMTESAIKLAGIQTALVVRGKPEKTVYLLGKVKPDERNISELTTRFGGRIEKLFVNFTGQNVRKGQKLATIYSPELIAARKELLEAIKYKESNPGFYKATRTKLKLWDLTDQQIDDLETRGSTEHYFDILSPISGTVTMRHVALGDYIKEGDPLFEVIDLTKVWVMFDAYESDLPWIRMGNKIDFAIQSFPGDYFTGKVTYIDPFINARTRVAKVRVELNNHGLSLKPEMFVNGLLKSEMEQTNELLIPKSSVLWTGKRAVVYVKVPNRSQPSFLYREIILGPEAGNFYLVKSGLHEGEEIALNGVFKIDAAVQLAGKPSMMNPEGGKVSTGHNHGAMDMTSEITETIKK
ncbi:Cation efflux system protein CusB [subsurface metagenome]